MLGEPSDSEADLDTLLLQVAEGDHDAFTAVYFALWCPVYGLCRRILRDTAQAEEVVQDVMIEVWRTAARFHPERGTAITWAMTIARNRAVDRVRSAQASAVRDHLVACRELVPPFDEVSEQVLTRFEHEQLRGCLGCLTDLQHKAIVLAYYDGLTYPEVAARLSAPLGTVKTRIRDALIRLCDCMGLPDRATAPALCADRKRPGRDGEWRRTRVARQAGVGSGRPSTDIDCAADG